MNKGDEIMNILVELYSDQMGEKYEATRVEDDTDDPKEETA